MMSAIVPRRGRLSLGHQYSSYCIASTAVRAIRLALILLAWGEAAMPYKVNAKDSPLRFDITRDAFWDSSRIVIAKVDSVTTNAGGKEEVSLEFIQSLDGSEVAGTRRGFLLAHIVPLNDWSEAHIDASVGDTLLLVIHNAPATGLSVGAVNMEASIAPSLVQTMREIVTLRGTMNVETLVGGLLGGNPSVAKYSGHRLRERQPLDVRRIEPQLRAKWRDPECDPELAAISLQLWANWNAWPQNSAIEFEMLKDVFLLNQNDVQSLRFLLNRMLEFEQKRSDFINFVCEAAVDQNAALAVRRAAIYSLADFRVLNSSSTVGLDRKIGQTCITLMRDADRRIRITCCDLLPRMANAMWSENGADSKQAVRLRDECVSILRDVRTNESDDGVAHRIDLSLRLLLMRADDGSFVGDHAGLQSPGDAFETYVESIKGKEGPKSPLRK